MNLAKMSIAKTSSVSGEDLISSFIPIPAAIQERWQQVSEDSSLAGTDRRKCRRVPAAIPARIRCGGPLETAAEISNLSAHGIFLRTDKRISDRVQIRLLFQLPEQIFRRDGVWMCCRGEVVRVDEGGPGQHQGIAAAIKQYEIFVA